MFENSVFSITISQMVDVYVHILILLFSCVFQDEKNQIMKSNVWLRMVSTFLLREALDNDDAL